MTAYNIFDTITQQDLDNIIDYLLDNFDLRHEASSLEESNMYCRLELDLNGNIETDTEYIVSNPFLIKSSEHKYLGIQYWLVLYYYDLKEGDIDGSKPYDELQTLIVPLNDGEWETVSFTAEEVFLQKNCMIIIKKEQPRLDNEDIGG